MSISIIDKKTALIIVDMQKGVTSMPTVHPMDMIIANCSALAAAFRKCNLPVVLVNATGAAPGRTEQQRPNVVRASDWAELIPELNEQISDIRVTKQRWGAFHDTKLDAELKLREVTQVVIAGIATTAGVESTARAAHEHAYHVTFVIDAMTDMSLEAHDNSIQRIFPRLGETGTTKEIIDLLGEVQQS
jgi:nicotinamidase-related amidase